MLGLQGNASAPKVYRCVACSDTFTGLASLLVHQATHANTESKSSTPPPAQPNDSLLETQLADEIRATEKPTSPALLPESPANSFYICDCGDEFLDFSLMLEHKRSHVCQLQQPVVDNLALTGGAEINNVFPTPLTSFASVIETGLDLSSPSTSKSSGSEVPTSNALSRDVALEDSVAMVTPPYGQHTPPQDVSVKPIEGMSTTGEPLPESEEDMDLEDNTDSVPLSEQLENVQKNNILMKLLASAYQNRLPPPESENETEHKVVPKQEDLPVDITPVAKAEASLNNDLSIVQMRRLLVKPGIKTKAPPISRVLESSKKRVVSLTKTLSPVVVLETRQKLMDPTLKGLYGRYQCGRCRKVFPNLDRLTEHHFLHKKERIKCCRRCKQLIIGRLPFSDNHICPPMRNSSFWPSKHLQNKLPFGPKIVPFHSLNNAKKVFFCPVCKNSYARRWNLKTHRCHGAGSGIQSQISPSFQRMLALKSNLGAQTARVEDANGGFKTVAVGTEVSAHIKIEGASQDSGPSAVSKLAWTPPAKTFPTFTLKASMIDSHQDPSLASLEEEDEIWKIEEENKGENGKEGQWTMPLDDEMQVLSSTGKPGDDGQLRQPGSVEHTEMTTHSLPYFVSEGVRRYPCNRCHKTYSKASTLRRHLLLCGVRPPGFGTLAQSQPHRATTLNTSNVKPMFSCFVCGRLFNRKDNMMTHRKRCQLKRTMSSLDGGIVLQSLQGDAPADSQIQEENSAGNWGIMSLPSVLPRRVTCECGVGFTSPRLLLEHLQKHAQESYTCPTCGETVNSWADYEVHLQIHMHPQHQLAKGLQAQRSQPLLLRLQQPQSTQSVLPPPQKPPRPEPSQHLHLLSVKKGPRIVCTRCGNSFATRCSLRRHISWNRCKGVRATNPPTNPPKTFHCSHCNSDFPNSISLIFHQRNGACKPAIKPVRCPVCLRWFGTMDSLQKHLLTHKQSDSFRCDVCQGTYRSLKSLKNHRRRIHRILIGQPKSSAIEPLTSECHLDLTD
ncbi:uncharacterized protein FYW61_006434 [Anableps anableps]